MFTCEFCKCSARYILSYNKKDASDVKVYFHFVCGNHSLVPVDWNIVFDNIMVLPANEEDFTRVIAWS